MMIILQNVYDNNEGTILSVQPFKNNDDYIVLSLGLFQLIHKMGEKKRDTRRYDGYVFSLYSQIGGITRKGSEINWDDLGIIYKR